MRVLGIIAARGGSKGLPEKNIRPLLGKPVIAYVIEAAQESSYIDRLVVTTDSEKIARVVSTYDVQVIKRPPEISHDRAPIELAYRHAVEHLSQEPYDPDIVVQLYANVPVRRKGDIDRVIEHLIETKADSIMTIFEVRHHPEALRVLADQRLQLYTETKAVTRQEFGFKAYAANGSVIATWKKVLMKDLRGNRLEEFLGNNVLGFVQERIYSVEIDDELDFLTAERFLQHLGTSPQGSPVLNSLQLTNESLLPPAGSA